MASDTAHFTQDQIFAAPSARRGRVVRAALAGGATLLAGWLTALTLGALGGFEALPELKLGGGSEKQSSEPEATGAATGKPANASVAKDDNAVGGSEQAAVEGESSPAPSTRSPARQVAKRVRRPTVTAPTTVTTKGNANGRSDTKTTGKPDTTPGTGSTGTNSAGGTGNGNGNGLYK